MSIGARARVLVADDSLVIRTVLRKQLEDQGHEVSEAVDGVEALRACRERIPDLILLDIEMPTLDGHQVLAELRRHPDTADIPVVFLTGRSSTEDVVEGLRLGAHDYLGKPFEPAELIARVSAALRVKRLQDELRLRNAELESISRTDALTGLPNRRHLQERLVVAAAAARRADGPMALLMVDVDHFKLVNDRFGHATGDHVLREIAATLHSVCRADEVAGRWGGEEFLVVAGGTTASGALVLGERVRRAIASSSVSLPAEELTVTVSVGVAGGIGDVDIDDLLRRADAAMYESKAGGRNRVTADRD